MKPDCCSRSFLMSVLNTSQNHSFQVPALFAFIRTERMVLVRQRLTFATHTGQLFQKILCLMSVFSCFCICIGPYSQQKTYQLIVLWASSYFKVIYTTSSSHWCESSFWVHFCLSYLNPFTPPLCSSTVLSLCLTQLQVFCFSGIN